MITHSDLREITQVMWSGGNADFIGRCRIILCFWLPNAHKPLIFWKDPKVGRQVPIFHHVSWKYVCGSRCLSNLPHMVAKSTAIWPRLCTSDAAICSFGSCGRDGRGQWTVRDYYSFCGRVARPAARELGHHDIIQHRQHPGSVVGSRLCLGSPLFLPSFWDWFFSLAIINPVN